MLCIYAKQQQRLQLPCSIAFCLLLYQRAHDSNLRPDTVPLCTATFLESPNEAAECAAGQHWGLQNKLELQDRTICVVHNVQCIEGALLLP